MATASDADAQSFHHNLKDRAVALPGTGRGNNRGPAYALTIFGRSLRESNCDCDRSSEASLLQVIFTRNDNDMHNMISRRDGWVIETANEVSGKTEDDGLGRKITALEQRIEKGGQALARAKKQGNEKQIEKTETQLKAARKQLKELQAQVKPADDPHGRSKSLHNRRRCVPSYPLPFAQRARTTGGGRIYRSSQRSANRSPRPHVDACEYQRIYREPLTQIIAVQRRWAIDSHFHYYPTDYFSLRTITMSLHRQCDGSSRRDFLKIGALGLGGMTLGSYLRAAETQSLLPGKAKSAIFIKPARRSDTHGHVRPQAERSCRVPRGV